MSENTGKHKLDQLVYVYRLNRTSIEDMEARHKEELKELIRRREVLTAALLDALDATGQEMARTKMGTVSYAKKETVSCSDPDEFITYVRNNDAYELMDRRANLTACLDYAEHHEGLMPPGVKYNVKRSVSVRTPKTKKG